MKGDNGLSRTQLLNIYLVSTITIILIKVSGLDLTKYLSGPLNDPGQRTDTGCSRDPKMNPIFNLYGCVCHFGSIHGGHYTSYAKHLATGQVGVEQVDEHIRFPIGIIL